MLLCWSNLREIFRRERPLRHPMQRIGWRTTLRGEQLEDRCVPTVYTWNAAADGLASVAGNWMPNGVPGVNDKMLFDGTKNTNCKLDTVTKVQDVEITAGYTGSITLENAQMQATTLEVTNTFTMNAPNATIFNGGGTSTLYVSGAGYFTWNAGRIRGLDIILGSTTNHAVTGKIDANTPIASQVILDDSHLINYGITTWVSGSIEDDTSLAEIINQDGGTIEVQASGLASYGSSGAAKFTNHGLLKFNTASVAIFADFHNANGTVRIYPGTVQFNYKAEQTGGTFDLRGGTVKSVSDEQVIRIYDGSITGSGAIQGNLTLGYEDGTGYPSIDPGIDGGIGTLAITLSFHIFSYDANTYLQIDANGNYDKITAGVYAVLAGTVNLTKDNAYQPPINTDLPLITAASWLSGTFDITNYYGSSFWGMSPPLTYGLKYTATSFDFYVARGGS